MLTFKKWAESSKHVRDAYENVENCILNELAKPGMTSSERESAVNELRRAQKDSRLWEELNEMAVNKRGETVGMIKATGLCIGGFVCGIVIGIIKNAI